MSPTNDSSDRAKSYGLFNMKMVTVGGEVGCLTLLIVLAAVFGGLWLDRLFGTKPVITIILVLSSAPLSLGLTFWLAMRAVKDINPRPSPGGDNLASKEEMTGE
jgi:MFS-type transporter involved in bile tolerance (Atg22 family)